MFRHSTILWLGGDVKLDGIRRYAELVTGSYSDSEMLSLTSDYLSQFGITGFNYFNSDPADRDLKTTKVSFYSTLPTEWLQDYNERGYQFIDHLAEHYRAGHRTPILGGPELQKYFKDLSPEQEIVMKHGAEAGLLSGVSLPVASLASIETDISGFTLCSLEKGSEFMKMIKEHGFELGLFLNAVHQNIGNKFIGKAAGFKQLTPREKDCLKYIAKGMRISALAYKLGISEVTVNFHLRNIRTKLKSRTVTEAVAKAIKYEMVKI